MNRTLISIICFIVFTSMSHAQYTSIINANRPGKTETPYSVGRGVFQVENSSFYKTVDNKTINNNTNSFNNDIYVQYGFLSERLQASLKHVFTHRDGIIDSVQKNILGTENLSIGLKYLIYNSVNKESPALKKSWKRRYGFKYNGLIPSIGIAAYVNTPFSNSRFNRKKTTGTVSLITQNNINKKLRINNQFDLKYIGAAYQEFVYSSSSSYVIAKRFNPYVQFRYHHLKKYNFFNIGIGTPFLVNRNMTLGVHYDATLGNKISGYEVGLNLAFRIDNHHDRWKRIHKSKDEKAPKNLIKKESIGNELTDPILDESIDDNSYLEEPKTKIIKSKKQLKKEKKRKKKKAKAEKKRMEKAKKQKEIDDVILSY